LPDEEQEMTKTALWILSLTAGLLVVLAAHPLAAQSGADLRTVLVMGTAPIVGDDLGAAREQAVDSGLSAAVDQVVLALLPVDRLVSRLDTVTGLIYRRLGDFVQGYQVLAETRVRQKVRVLIQVNVLQSALDRELKASGLIADAHRLPRILMFVTETSLQHPEPQYWWKEDFAFVQTVSDTALARAFSNAGFPLARQGGVVSNAAVQSINYNPAPEDVQLLDAARVLQSQMIVAGSAEVQIASNTMGGEIRTFKATVTLRALQVDTGQQLGAVTRTAVTANADPIMGSNRALADAASQAGESLAATISTAWQAAAEQAAALRITVKGTDDLAHFVAFRRTISGIEGVKTVLTTEIQAAEAVLSVHFEPGAEALAQQLMLQSFDAFGINIYEVTPDHLGIELIPG
jgi:hypothetical protein